MDDDYTFLRRGPGLLTVVLVSALTSGLITAGALYAWQRGWLAGPAEHTAEAYPSEVPKLTGMDTTSAAELLEGRRLRLLVTARRPDADAPSGSVLEQEPLPGSVLEPGGRVSVTVSAGPPRRVQVPTLGGKTLAEARTALEKAGLKARPLPQGAPDDAVVEHTEPGAGSEVAAGADVVLQVGARVEVPTLIGLRYRKALKALEAAGLSRGRVRETYDEDKLGMVIVAQDPPPGARVAPKSKVDLTRNQGD